MAHIEVDQMVIPGWKCGEVEVCSRLKGKVSKKKDFVYSMLAYVREYLEKWEAYFQIYTDGSKCEEGTAYAFYIPVFIVHSQFRV